MMSLDNRNKKELIAIIQDLETENDRLQKNLNKYKSRSHLSKDELIRLNSEIEQQNEELTQINEKYAALNEELARSNTELEGLYYEIKNSEEKFQNFIDQSSDGISVTGKDGDIIIWNLALEKITGYSWDDVKDRKIWDIQWEIATGELKKNYSKDKIRELLQNIDSENSLKWAMKNTAITIRNKDGNELNLQQTTFPVKVGTSLYMGSIIRDITELKNTENELIKRNEFIQTILDNLPIGIALNKFNEGSATYMNRKFVEIYGWPEKEVRNVNEFFKKVYPERKYRTEIKKRILTDIESGDIRRMHWENIHITCKDGSKKTINAVNIPLFEQNTMVSTVMDITALRMAEEAARNKSRELSEIIEALPDAVVYADNERRIMLVNKAFTKIFGYSRDEVYGKKTEMIYVSKKEFLEQGKRRYNLEAPSNDEIYEIRYKKKNGEVFWSQSLGTPVRDTHGNLIGLLGLVRDITRQKETEKELSLYREQLEEKIKERTREIEEKNEQLERMNKLFVGREFRIKELRDEIKELKRQLG